MARISNREVTIYINLNSCHGGEVLGDLNRLGKKWGLEIFALTELRHMENVIKSFDSDLKWLIIVGGDGTIFRLFNCLIAQRGVECLEKINIVAICGGTMDCLSHGWAGWSRSPVYNLKLAIQALQNRRLSVTELPLLKVERGQNCLYGVKFFAGPPVRILDQYNQFNTTKFVAFLFAIGALSAGLLGWPRRVVDQFERVQSEIVIDGKKLPFDQQIGISMSSMPQLIPGVYPYRGECDGLNEAFAFVYGAGYKETILRLPLIARGILPGGKGGYFNQPAREMRVKLKTDMMFTLDGETFRAVAGEEIVITVGPTISVAISPNMGLRYVDGIVGRADYQLDRLRKLWRRVVPTKK